MSGRASLERRLVLNAAFAAAVTGALIGLAGCVFSTFLGFPPSPAVLAGVVGGLALAGAVAAVVLIARHPAARRAVGLGEPRPARRSR